MPRIKKYFRENWGAPLFIEFILLLMVAAASLSIGLESLANEVAICAYYALVAGVVLQFVCFLKYGERSGTKD